VAAALPVPKALKRQTDRAAVACAELMVRVMELCDSLVSLAVSLASLAESDHQLVRSQKIRMAKNAAPVAVLVARTKARIKKSPSTLTTESVSAAAGPAARRALRETQRPNLGVNLAKLSRSL